MEKEFKKEEYEKVKKSEKARKEKDERKYGNNTNR